MHFLQRLLFVLTLGLTATSVAANKIRQPASVLPWRAAEAKVAPVLNDPLPSGEYHSPAWLLDSAKQRSTPSENRQDMPMVELENFAHLGQLQAGAEKSNRLSGRPSRVVKPAIRQSLNIFRALGFQAAAAVNP